MAVKYERKLHVFKMWSYNQRLIQQCRNISKKQEKRRQYFYEFKRSKIKYVGHENRNSKETYGRKNKIIIGHN